MWEQLVKRELKYHIVKVSHFQPGCILRREYMSVYVYVYVYV